MALTHFAQALTTHLVFCNFVLAAAPGILDSLKNTRSLHALPTASLVENSARSQNAYHAEFFFCSSKLLQPCVLTKKSLHNPKHVPYSVEPISTVSFTDEAKIRTKK